MSFADILKEAGSGLATGAKAVGAVLEPVAKRTAEVVSGEAPQIDEEKRQQAQRQGEQATEAKAQQLESQLEMGRKYGTLNPDQQKQYVDAITQLYSHPSQMGTLVSKLHKMTHPDGATYQTAPLTNATPKGGTVAADEQGKLNAAQQTDDQKLAQAKKEIDSWASTLKASGVSDDQVSVAKNEAIERAMGAMGNVLPKNSKLDIQGGILVGGTDEHGRTFTNAQIQSGEGGPALKAMQDDFQKGEQAKTDTADKKAKEKQVEADKRQAEIESRFERSLNAREQDKGTWEVVEGDKGQSQLMNSKTGEMRDAPGGMHKSGYFAKQIAPLEAASMNIDTYLEGKVYDGPGDLSLQHEFFTATQPSTGFRMTKVQQDILQGSQSWLDSWQAKAHHATTGTWFSDKQRQQIADAARQAIAAKKASLSGATGANPVAGSIPKVGASPAGGGNGPTQGAFGTAQHGGKTYWVDKDGNNLGEKK
jgi:hypothetical protein